MGTGYLRIQDHTGDDALPVAGAQVIIKDRNGNVLYRTETDLNGDTPTLPLHAVDADHTLEPNYSRPAYTLYDVDIYARGYLIEHIHNVEIVDTQTTILPVSMLPLADEPNPDTDVDVDLAPVALLLSAPYRKRTSQPLVLHGVLIPDYITVHLGIPTNAAARNVRVRFADYIKNVASSEIYSTWPYNSLVANIHAITTFAINRVYTEWYRSRGFNFDITNSTSYDMAFRDGGPIFQNISQIVDNIFNVYARRIGFANPFFTQFCNGSTVTCPGLSQWGTVTLANQGRTPLEILRYFYPSDLELVASQNITGITESYPGYPLSLGSTGEAVRRIQQQLNRIRVNYPLIPLISSVDGVFGTSTQNAVRTFQRTFDLTADGVVGRATWNRLSFIFVAVTRLAELDSEGQRVTIGTTPPNVVLSQGARGPHVLELQFILNVVSAFYDSVPPVIEDSVFGPGVKNAVIEFQKTFGLAPDGVVGPATWNKLYAVYRGIDQNVPQPEIPTPEPPGPTPTPPAAPPFPGTLLRIGSTGADVRLMQSYLKVIRSVYTNIPSLTVDGIFGNETYQTVVAFQREFNLAPDGIIGPATWNEIVKQYNLVTGNISVSLEYPGTPLRIGSTGNAVRLMQGFLAELRAPYPSLPAVTVDGIFGPNTEAAVMAFQRLFGLTADGVIGPVTWYAIINQRNAVV